MYKNVQYFLGREVYDMEKLGNFWKEDEQMHYLFILFIYSNFHLVC